MTHYHDSFTHVWLPPPPCSFVLKPIFNACRVQELLKHEDHEEGRVPRTVECELTQDLVDTCIPGDVVTVTGIIRGINNYMDIGGGIIVTACFFLSTIYGGLY